MSNIPLCHLNYPDIEQLIPQNMWLHMVYTVTDNFISRRISVQDLRGRYGIEGNIHFHIEAQVIGLYILLKYFIFTIFPSDHTYVLNF